MIPAAEDEISFTSEAPGSLSWCSPGKMPKLGFGRSELTGGSQYKGPNYEFSSFGGFPGLGGMGRSS